MSTSRAGSGRSRGTKFVASIASAAALLSAFAAPAGAFVNNSTRSCEGQSFSQPFLAFGDSHFYTLAPGGNFNSAAEGWTFSRGAHVVGGSRPGGAFGGVLSLPAGSEAVSPPICVTLEYAKAVVWLKSSALNSPVTVSISYAETKTAEKPKKVGQLASFPGNWGLSKPFDVKPQAAGSEEGTREVRFIFTAGSSEAQLDEFWVDPRMK